MLVYLLYWYKSTNSDAERIRTTSHTRVANASSAGSAHVTLAGSTSAEATEAEAAEAAVKPPPLTDDEFLAKLEQVKQAKSAAEQVKQAKSAAEQVQSAAASRAAAPQNSAAPLDSTRGGAQEAEPVEAVVSGEPAGAVATATTATASLPGSSASGGGTGGDSGEVGSQPLEQVKPFSTAGASKAGGTGGDSGEVGGGMKFCKEMYGVNSEYNAGDGQCRCREGFKEDSLGVCVAVESERAIGVGAPAATV
jgi:hypothetical protein